MTVFHTSPSLRFILSQVMSQEPTSRVAAAKTALLAYLCVRLGFAFNTMKHDRVISIIPVEGMWLTVRFRDDILEKEGLIEHNTRSEQTKDPSLNR